MRMYLFSLGAGVMVGVIYSLIDVSSPAPSVVARSSDPVCRTINEAGRATKREART